MANHYSSAAVATMQHRYGGIDHPISQRTAAGNYGIRKDPQAATAAALSYRYGVHASEQMANLSGGTLAPAPATTRNGKRGYGYNAGPIGGFSWVGDKVAEELSPSFGPVRGDFFGAGVRNPIARNLSSLGDNVLEQMEYEEAMSDEDSIFGFDRSDLFGTDAGDEDEEFGIDRTDLFGGRGARFPKKDRRRLRQRKREILREQGFHPGRRVVTSMIPGVGLVATLASKKYRQAARAARQQAYEEQFGDDDDLLSEEVFGIDRTDLFGAGWDRLGDSVLDEMEFEEIWESTVPDDAIFGHDGDRSDAGPPPPPPAPSVVRRDRRAALRQMRSQYGLY